MACALTTEEVVPSQLPSSVMSLDNRTPPWGSQENAVVFRKGNRNRLMPVSDVLRDTQFYFIYFSANWCPHCRAFTPRLRQFYELFAAVCRFEVIFFSLDKSAAEMNEYFNTDHANWCALPYDYAKKYRGAYTSAFDCEGIPMLCAVPRLASPNPTPFPNLRNPVAAAAALSSMVKMVDGAMEQEVSRSTVVAFQSALAALLQEQVTAQHECHHRDHYHHLVSDAGLAAAAPHQNVDVSPSTNGFHPSSRLSLPAYQCEETLPCFLEENRSVNDGAVIISVSLSPGSSMTSSAASSLSQFPTPLLSSSTCSIDRRDAPSRKSHRRSAGSNGGAPKIAVPTAAVHLPALLLCLFFALFWTGMVLYFWLF